MDDDDDDGYDVLQDVSNKTKRKKDLFLFSFKRVFKQIFFEFIHSFFWNKFIITTYNFFTKIRLSIVVVVIQRVWHLHFLDKNFFSCLNFLFVSYNPSVYRFSFINTLKSMIIICSIKKNKLIIMIFFNILEISYWILFVRKKVRMEPTENLIWFNIFSFCFVSHDTSNSMISVIQLCCGSWILYSIFFHYYFAEIVLK